LHGFHRHSIGKKTLFKGFFNAYRGEIYLNMPPKMAINRTNEKQATVFAEIILFGA
jgi:hypothetical protein